MKYFRFIAVRYPLQAKHLCTQSRLIILMFMTMVFIDRKRDNDDNVNASRKHFPKNFQFVCFITRKLFKNVHRVKVLSDVIMPVAKINEFEY